MSERLRIAYTAGSGDVWQVYKDIAAGRVDQKSSHVAYSELFLRACRDVDAEALVLTMNPGDTLFKFPGVEVRSMPNRFLDQSGPKFHFASLRMAADVRAALRDFKPDVVLLADDPPRAIATELVRVGNPAVVRVHHCTMWPFLRNRSLLSRLLFAIDGPIVSRRFSACLSASSIVSAQVEQVARGAAPPIVDFLPHYRPDMYSAVPPADANAPVLRILTIGRVETNKGVFDLLEAANLVRERTDIAFDVCGSGTALPELRERVARLGLGDRFVLHGWCDGPKLREILSKAHVGCVPTRSSFVEGFNQSCVEMILAGRPVIASCTIPALPYVARAIHEVRHDDPASYAQAFRELADDRSRYERLRSACQDEGVKFLREDTSFRAALTHVFRALQKGERVTPRRIGFNGNLIGGSGSQRIDARG